MKFAICNETFVDWPFENAFAFAAECGYTGIEIAPFTLTSSESNARDASDARSIPSKQIEMVNALCEKNGLEMIGLHWLLAKTSGFYFTSPDKAVQKKTADYFGTLAKLCRDMGGKVLVLGSPQQRNLLSGVTLEAATDYAEATILEALPTLEACNVVLALEPLGPAEGDFLQTAQEAASLIERIGSPYVQLHLDCKAMASEAIPIPTLIETHKEITTHFHANDPNRQGPGFGQLDFKPILNALQTTGYEGWISVEVFDYSPGIEKLAKKSIENLKACL